VPAQRYRDRRFLLLAPDLDRYKMTFERGADGEVTALVHGPRWMGREGVDHADPGDPPAAWRAYPGVYQNYNPWRPRFEVYLRRGSLYVDLGYGWGQKLIELDPGVFQVGDSPSADRMSFDAVADGQALRADLNGQSYYRTLWSSLPATRR
jgi:hypothetical protein